MYNLYLSFTSINFYATESYQCKTLHFSDICESIGVKTKTYKAFLECVFQVFKA